MWPLPKHTRITTMNLTASKASSLEKLDYFLSENINRYENNRNFDFGPQNQKIVSCLSPYITHRVLSEYDIIKEVISTNTSKNSAKFVQEILWRIYWRGWLETHSEVWTDFVKETFGNQNLPGQRSYLRQLCAHVTEACNLMPSQQNQPTSHPASQRSNQSTSSSCQKLSMSRRSFP